MASSSVSAPAAANSSSPSTTVQNPSDGQDRLCFENPRKDEEEELHRLLVPDPVHLPPTPSSAIHSNFVSYFAPDFLKPGHDQYVYRHANGLCVIGLAPTHVALASKGVTAVDFNVGKSDRSDYKVTGKRKKNAQHLEPNSAVCKIYANETVYIVRCCVKGSLLEVNDKLIKQPGLLNTSAEREGYIAIIMPKPADWLKIKDQPGLFAHVQLPVQQEDCAICKLVNSSVSIRLLKKQTHFHIFKNFQGRFEEKIIGCGRINIRITRPGRKIPVCWKSSAHPLDKFENNAAKSSSVFAEVKTDSGQ